MKNKVAKLSVFYISVMAALIIAGCFVINTVTQPASVETSQQFTSTVNVTVDAQYDDSNPHYGIVGIKIPNDFMIDSVWFTGTFTGACTFLPANVSDGEPGGNMDYWTDSLETRYPSGADMKWVVYQSNDKFTTIVGSVPETLKVKMTAGLTSGNFNIGYFVSDAALDFSDPTWYSVSLSNPLTVNSITPVELTSFSANSNNDGVQLNWETATETNNHRFEIERSIDNKNFTWVGSVLGKGTTTEKSKYSFTDRGIKEGKYYYHLKQYDFNGSFEYSKNVEVEYSGVQNFNLSQNYPNPFNPGTEIKFSLPVESDVALCIYTTGGELVKTLLQGRLQSGSHTYNFNATGLSSGIYLYTLNAKGINGVEFSKTSKMLLLK